MRIRTFVEAEEAEEGDIATTGALLQISRSVDGGVGIDVIGWRHHHQHAQRTPAGMAGPRLRAFLEEPPELAHVEDAGCACRRRP